jgi:hypothetical protein
MRKVLLVVAIAVFALGAANAQTGKNQLGIGAEVGIGTASGSKASFGGSAKYLHGVGSAGQATLSVGYLTTSDKESEGSDELKVTGSTIPVMLGYRHNFSGFYAEPQLGYLFSNVTTKFNGTKVDELSGSDGSFGYAIGAGYALESGLDLGVRFLNSTQSGATGLFVFRIGYNFSLGGASK